MCLLSVGVHGLQLIHSVSESLNHIVSPSPTVDELTAGERPEVTQSYLVVVKGRALDSRRGI